MTRRYSTSCAIGFGLRARVTAAAPGSAAPVRLIDGEVSAACHMPLSVVAGKHVERVEGLAAQLQTAPLFEAIVVRHAQGAGCYLHNGADDGAYDAAAIDLRRPGVTIRAQWSREDEFAHEPLGPAMLIEIRVELDEQQRPTAWVQEIWSGSHGDRSRLLAEDAQAPSVGEAAHRAEPNRRLSGAVRNAQPPYGSPKWSIIDHMVRQPPVRTSSLRSLGSMGNVFAAESFIDEMAAIACEDPLAYRLSLCNDRRQRKVLEPVAAMAGWGRDARALALGYVRYKNNGAYTAVAAEVEVDQEVRVRALWCAADCGLVINPDGGAQPAGRRHDHGDELGPEGAGPVLRQGRGLDHLG